MIYGGILLVLYIPVPVLVTLIALNRSPEWHREYIGDWLLAAYLALASAILLGFAVGRRVMAARGHARRSPTS